MKWNFDLKWYNFCSSCTWLAFGKVWDNSGCPLQLLLDVSLGSRNPLEVALNTVLLELVQCHGILRLMKRERERERERERKQLWPVSWHPSLVLRPVLWAWSSSPSLIFYQSHYQTSLLPFPLLFILPLSSMWNITSSAFLTLEVSVMLHDFTMTSLTQTKKVGAICFCVRDQATIVLASGELLSWYEIRQLLVTAVNILFKPQIVLIS